MSTTDIKALQEIVAGHLHRKGSSKKFVGTIYCDLESLEKVLKYFADEYKGKVDTVVALDGSGYILGSMLAREMSVAFVPVVKESEHNVFDGEYYRSSYINHRDKARSLVMRKDCVNKSGKILIVDNWIETGATIEAMLAIMEDAEVNVEGVVTFGIDKNPKTDALKKDIHVTAIIE